MLLNESNLGGTFTLALILNFSFPTHEKASAGTYQLFGTIGSLFQRNAGWVINHFIWTSRFYVDL